MPLHFTEETKSLWEILHEIKAYYPYAVLYDRILDQEWPIEDLIDACCYGLYLEWGRKTEMGVEAFEWGQYFWGGTVAGTVSIAVWMPPGAPVALLVESGVEMAPM